MATKNLKTKKLKEVNGEYLGIVPPNLDFFNVDLRSTYYVETDESNEEEKILSQNYIIKIDTTKISKAFHNVLSKDLKEIFEMNFIKFDWNESKFVYYTSKYVKDENKLKILNNTLNYLINFEKEYALFKEQNSSVFEKEKENFNTYKDEKYVIKYNKKANNIIVISLQFLERNDYLLLSKTGSPCKVNSLVLGEDIDEDFFNDINFKIVNKKTCFLVLPENYVSIKNIIESGNKKQKDFLIEQTKIEEEFGSEIDNYNFTEENIFGFRLVPNKEKKCFEFSLRGYHITESDFSSQYNSYTQRGLISQWALDLISSEYVESEKYNPETHQSRTDITFANYYRIDLDYEKDKSIKSDILYVPFSELDKIKIIYNNFLEQNKILKDKTIKTIKINHLNGLTNRAIDANFNSYPSIYINEKNKIYFIFKMINISSKLTTNKKTGEEENKAGYLSMKGIEISYAEMNDLLKNHPYADYLLKNARFLNTEAKINAHANPSSLTTKERDNAWEAILMTLRFHEEDKLKNQVLTKKRVFKI